MKKQNLVSLALLLIITAGCSKDAFEIESTKEVAVLKSPSTHRSASGDVVGKVVVGYQGWFACAGDGSAVNRWVHWGQSQPSPGNQTFELWPDVREYARTFPTGYGNLGNGTPATLYASSDNNVVDIHFKWMKQYGIDCAAVQRFGSELSDPTFKSQRDAIATKVRNAAQTFDRKFYIMYDISGWTNFQSEIKTDWTNTISGSLGLTSSSAYARQNGKPVVCIWGVGVAGRPGSVTSWTEVINWFKGQGCYVIVGTGKNWRTNLTNFPAVIAADMIEPWFVGYFGASDADVDLNSKVMDSDQVECDKYNKDYQPVVWAGFAWSNWNGGIQNQIPRRHGDFMWRQFAQVRNRNIPNVYVAMFDEYDEGTAIAKAAENGSMKPTSQYFLTLDADGTACSSDFYMRLVSDGAKMVKQITPLTWTHPTPHLNYLDRCDATSGWGSANGLSISGDRKDSSASLQSVGGGTDEFRKVFSPFNSGASASSGYLTFWYYVSDVSKFSASNQVELGSGGTSDSSEYNWSIGPLVNGWNRIELPFSGAAVTGGAINLNAINWFRIYHFKTGSVTTRVDGIQIIP